MPSSPTHARAESLGLALVAMILSAAACLWGPARWLAVGLALLGVLRGARPAVDYDDDLRIVALAGVGLSALVLAGHLLLGVLT